MFVYFRYLETSPQKSRRGSTSATLNILTGADSQNECTVNVHNNWTRFKNVYIH